MKITELFESAKPLNKIRFKPPGWTDALMRKPNSEQLYIDRILKAVQKKSVEFTGVDISPFFVRDNGEFNLYGKFYFTNSAGNIYYWTGANTENWKGFSVVIAQVDAAPEGVHVIKAG